MRQAARAIVAVTLLLLTAGRVQGQASPTPAPTPTPIPTPTPAPTCGGRVACQCGDTLVGTYVMQSDLVCNGAGLTLGDGAVLRCNHHTITGPGGDNSFFGIYLFQAHGAKVRYCKVTGFRRGVRIDQGAGNLVENVEAFGNGDPVSHRQGGYGIDVGSSTDNLIRKCYVHDNADEGIHIGGGSDRTTLRNTKSFDNFREQLYVFDNSGVVLIGNKLRGSQQTSAAVFFMKQSLGGTVSDLQTENGNFTIRGGSRGNAIERLKTTAGGIRFETDETGAPSGNRILRSRVNRAFECLRYRSAFDNAIIDSSFSGCTFGIIGNGTSDQPAQITLAGVTVPPQASITLDSFSTLDVAWHLDVVVRDAANDPVPSAMVTVTDGQGQTVVSASTDPSGRIATADILVEQSIGTSSASFTPHHVVADKAGVGSAALDVTLTGNRSLVLVLR